MELTKTSINNKRSSHTIHATSTFILHKRLSRLIHPLIMIKCVPLVYYLSLFGDCCVAIYCFCSGYGLMCTYKNNL